jgi:5-methylcytosine-specific restriction protein B
MPITYSRTAEDTFFVPENVHVIGMINTADRSLARQESRLRGQDSLETFRFSPNAFAFGQFLTYAGIATSTAVGENWVRFVGCER